MRKSVSILTCIIVFTFFHSASLAQNLLYQPESVVFDTVQNRYLVSNWRNGHLVQIDSLGAQSYFIYNQHCHAGLHLMDGVVYVACREWGVKGFDLTTGSNTLNESIPEAGNINDITADNAGNLYVSYPTGNKIFKVNIASGNVSTFVEAGMGLITPNGIYFDEPNNRILVVSYRTSSPVQAVSLADSSVSTIAANYLHNMDGLTQDNEGNFYVSTWYYNAVYKCGGDFLGTPEVFATFGDDPADIYINKRDNVLAAPLFQTNSLQLIPIPPSEVKTGEVVQPKRFSLAPGFPNPFNNTVNLSFTLQTPGNVKLEVFNTHGIKAATLEEGNFSSGAYKTNWNAESFPSGVYFIRLTADNQTAIQKLVLQK